MISDRGQVAAGRIADGAAFLPIQSSTIWVTKPTSARISEIAPSRNPLILSFPRRDTTLSYCPERVKGYRKSKNENWPFDAWRRAGGGDGRARAPCGGSGLRYGVGG